MNFDIKDVKSWATRNEVKVGDEGYFIHSIKWLKDDVELNVNTIACIRDDFGNCFVSEKSFNGCNGFPFFVPLNAVKKDKPKEKKYRPFEDLYEFYKFVSISPVARKDFCRNMLLGFSFTYREKKFSQCATTTMINRIDFDANDDPRFCYINNRDFKDWFDNYEIMNNKGEWQPFGIEVKDD